MNPLLEISSSKFKKLAIEKQFIQGGGLISPPHRPGGTMLQKKLYETMLNAEQFNILRRSILHITSTEVRIIQYLLIYNTIFLEKDVCLFVNPDMPSPKKTNIMSFYGKMHLK